MSVAFITVCSWISFPFAVNFSLQTFAIFLIAAAFPASVSLPAVAIYILLGLVGIPVFSGFNSGLSALFGPSGGYIIAFLPVATIISAFRKKFLNQSLIYVAVATLSTTVCYVFGCIWYVLIFSPSTTVLSALTICVFPFIIPDCTKILLSAIILKKLTPYINKLQL